MSLPLDEDGFLRRECPTCEREFKWLPDQGDELDDQSVDTDPDGYFCPYCAVQAPTDHWLTKQQAEDAEAIVLREVMGPALEDLGRSMKRINRSGLVRADVDYDLPAQPEAGTEDITMRRVDFACHPEEPLKVLDSWGRAVHCLVCSTPA